MNDRDLHSLFARERRLDSQRVPVFQHLLTRARHQVAASPQLRLRWSLAAASAVVVVALGLVMMGDRGAPAPSLAKTLPTLLEARDDEKAEPLFPSLASSADTPSDFLMPRHTTFKVL